MMQMMFSTETMNFFGSLRKESKMKIHTELDALYQVPLQLTLQKEIHLNVQFSLQKITLQNASKQDLILVTVQVP